MAVITYDFLENRKNAARYKTLILSIGIFLILGAVVALGFVLFEGRNKKGDKVAGVSAYAGVLPKDWLLKYFGTDNENDERVGGADGDPDDDILTNSQEYLFGTDPTNPDTDGDGQIDSFEIAFGHNPLGEGDLLLSAQAKAYAEEIIKNDSQLKNYTEDRLYERISSIFQADRAVVLDLPTDSELHISKDNSKEAFETYYNLVNELNAAEDRDINDIQNRLFADISIAELDGYVARLDIIEKLLKDITVPSDLIEIQKSKIATLRAGKKILELVRNNPLGPNGDRPAQFWTDVFYQVIAVQTASYAELNKWQEIVLALQNTNSDQTSPNP